MQIVIIGAGASGLAAAISAARADSEACIVVLEKKDRAATKLLATGNGRCNITNTACDNQGMVLGFLNSVGIFTCEEEEGRVYPISEQAKDVHGALLSACNHLGVRLHTNSRVNELKPPKEKGQKFVICCEEGKVYEADRVILSAGGKSGSMYGTTGDSYTLAKSLGHTVGKLAPVLTPLEIKGFNGEFKGVRAKAKVTLFNKEQEVAVEKGEVQFTEKGVSGICIFNLSRFLILNKETSFEDYSLEIDFFSGNEKELYEIFNSNRKIKGLLAGELLRTLVNEKLAESIIKEMKINPKEQAELVSDDKLKKMASFMKAMKLTIKGAGGWNQAQCTRGGVVLSEVDGSSMESKLVQGLFITGEALDYDGQCGGFNLHNAWETGILAGQAAVKAVR